MRNEMNFMHLTDEEKSILDGKQGAAARIALAILVDLGELFGGGLQALPIGA